MGFLFGIWAFCLPFVYEKTRDPNLKDILLFGIWAFCLPFVYQKNKRKITSFLLYLYTTFQAVFFLTNVDRQCSLLGILLQV
ncbi:hypothetical protein Hanom_Chr00s000001g01596461 [Helianthus anomalus]